MSELSDKALIVSFLQETKKRSDGSLANNKTAIRLFFDYIKKPIQTITMTDVRNYFISYIDSRSIKITTKNSHRYRLKSFFEYVKNILSEHGIDYENPVPSMNIFRFTKKKGDIKRISIEELKILTKNQISELMEYTYTNQSLRDFILLGLVVCTGARISEIRSILINDLHIEERFFETGFVINARKSTLNKERGLLFFFPKKIIKYLKEYLEIHSKDSEWLFPGYMENHISKSKTDIIYKKLSRKTNIKFSWHYFRRAIITERRKMDCPEWLSEALMNRVPSTVERESYIKLKIYEKRELYDKFFPFYKIKFFKK